MFRTPPYPFPRPRSLGLSRPGSCRPVDPQSPRDTSEDATVGRGETRTSSQRGSRRTDGG